MNYQEIIQKIKTKNFSSIYLLDGEDSYLKQTIIDQLRLAILTNQEDDFNTDTLFADQITWDAFENAVMQIPWGEDYRLVILKNAQKMVSTYKDQLAKLVDNFPESTVLVCIADKFDKKFKFVKDIGKKGVHFSTSELSRKEIKDFAKEQIAKYKKTITNETLDLLIELADPSPQMLIGDIRKLCIYIGSREKIESSDIEASFDASHNDDVFNLVDLIAQKNSAQALVLLDVILQDRGQSLSIVGLLRWHIRVLIRVKYYERLRQSPAEYRGRLGVIPYKAPSFIDQARKYTEQQLTYFLLLFSRLSTKLKGADVFEQRYLEAAILAMAYPLPDLHNCFDKQSTFTV